MSTALQELENFTHFAQQTLGDTPMTLEQCLRLWRQHCEEQAVLDDIRQGEIDYEKGLAIPLDEAFRNVRRQLGIEQ
jgi:hypothetical protein